MAKTVTIAVLNANADGSLDLAIGVDSGDTVIWQVEDGSNVASIDAIIDTSSGIQLFDNGGPTDQTPGGPKTPKKWSGKVSNIATRKIETYCINYTRTDGTKSTHDPKIIANP
jgi:hypothetical protein